MNGNADEKLVGFLPPAKAYNLFQRSYNYAFHTEFDVRAHTFCTFDVTNFDQYHKVWDEVSLMDYGHMANLVNKTIPVFFFFNDAATTEIYTLSLHDALPIRSPISAA